MDIKPSLKQDKETGYWTASYTNKDGKIYKCWASSAGEAIKLWYSKYSGKFNLKRG